MKDKTLFQNMFVRSHQRANLRFSQSVASLCLGIRKRLCDGVIWEFHRPARLRHGAHRNSPHLVAFEGRQPGYVTGNARPAGQPSGYPGGASRLYNFLGSVSPAMWMPVARGMLVTDLSLHSLTDYMLSLWDCPQ